MRSLTPASLELPYRPLWPVAQALMPSVPGLVFLDSGGPLSEEARWSILAWRPRRVLAWPQGRPGALAALRDHLASARLAPPADSPLPFHGGWIGWFGYDLGRHIESLPCRAQSDHALPDYVISEYDRALVEDRIDKRLYVAGAGDPPPDADSLLAHADDALQRSCSTDPALVCADPAATPPPRSSLDRDHYCHAVQRILAYIRAGDVYQANFSHRFDARARVPSWDLYRRLRAASPAPHGCYLALPRGPRILSISPERFLHRRGRRVETRPIKGTRPRDSQPTVDAHLRNELLQSEKERAELLMIVDLLRNDLGRVARIGTVRVEELRELVAHPTVHHAVATIAADLDPQVDATALLAATMPGGSVTGAPKIRAMEILGELEEVRRGPYSGSAGYIGYDGDLSLNILIRTLVQTGHDVTFHVGGGIVADSDPDAEYDETLAKARPMLRALMDARA